MTWQAAVACAALAASPIAARGSDGNGDSGGDTSPGLTAAEPSEAQLGDALLSVDDLNELGSGWTETRRDVFTTREPENPSIDSSLLCPAGEGDELVTLAGPAGADVELSTAVLRTAAAKLDGLGAS